MIPPLCDYCRQRPVKRHLGTAVHMTRPPRIVHGLAWRCYCSRTCCGKSRGPAANLASLQQAARAWRAERRQVHLRALVARCRAIEVGGMVPIEAMVKIVVEGERKAYARGWDAAMSRARRIA